jgi:peptide/nickel transport system ATP-binding protein
MTERTAPGTSVAAETGPVAPVAGPVAPEAGLVAPAAGPVVEVSGLSVAYGQVPAVSGLDLSIAAGETVAIVGESGSGKTTTANAIIGLLPASAAITAGTVRVLGDDVTRAREPTWRRIRGRVVGLVPQDPMVALNPTLRIGTQVAEAVRERGVVDRRRLSVEVVETLERAGLDNAVLRARQYPHELSGGMRQRVLIAIALAGQPRLLIADEPTSALDVTSQRRILDHLESLVRDSGTALLVITHDLGVAADRANRVIVMRAGEIVEQGPPATVLVAPKHAYARRLIAAAPGLAAVSRPGGLAAATPRPEPGPKPATGDGREILRLAGVTKDFALPRSPGGPRTHRAVDDVSLTVTPGRTLGLVGESGSGKTTTLRLALGLETPSAGEVFFDGQRISGLGWRRLRPLRRRFQLVHQNPFASLDPRFTLYQTIVEPLVSFRVGTPSQRRARVVELLDAVALPRALLRRRPAELSGGQRQRVAIARALTLAPELLLLDEPVSALDVSVQAQILDLLAELQRELGLAYLFISHDLAVVSRLAHTVAVMRAGRIVEQGPAARVFSAPRSDYTRELIAAIPGQRAAASASAAATASAAAASAATASAASGTASAAGTAAAVAASR